MVLMVLMVLMVRHPCEEHVLREIQHVVDSSTEASPVREALRHEGKVQPPQRPQSTSRGPGLADLSPSGGRAGRARAGVSGAATPFAEKRRANSLSNMKVGQEREFARREPLSPASLQPRGRQW